MKRQFCKAIEDCYSRGFLEKIFGQNINFDIYLHYGSGAYVCGEETALIESLEGKKDNQAKATISGNVGALQANNCQQCRNDSIVPTILKEVPIGSTILVGKQLVLKFCRPAREQPL